MIKTMTAEDLKKELFYRKSDGVFIRKIGKPNSPKGSIAGCENSRGYVIIKVGGVAYKAHRLAWLYNYGEFPQKGIDHINHIKNDNRIINLRDVDQSENCRNASNQNRSKSGVKGICWHKPLGKWRACISFGGKQRHLGYYYEIEDAIIKREWAKKKYGYHPNHA